MTSTEEKRLQALEVANDRAQALGVAFDDGVEVEARAGTSGALVCAYFAMRTYRQLAAAVHLCSHGFGVESQSLLRNMAQDMADVRYIATDPSVLAESWRQHESRRRYYTYISRRGRQEIDEPADFAELEELIDADWAEAKSLAGAKHHKEAHIVSRGMARNFLLKDRWTRLSIRGAAEAAEKKYPGTLEMFGWYSFLSENAHGSPALAGDYLQSVDGVPYVKDHRDPTFKSASLALAALVQAHAVFVALRDIGLKYDPAPLIDDVPFTDAEFGDM